jgi:hypothetical protein
MDTELTRRLSVIQAAVDALAAKTRQVMTETPAVEPTEEQWQELAQWGGSRRYVLIRPDGERYWDVPFYSPLSSFEQRPAALRAMGGAPGARIADLKTKTIIEPKRKQS